MNHSSPYVQQNNEAILLSITQIFEILNQPYPISEFLLILKLQSGTLLYSNPSAHPQGQCQNFCIFVVVDGFP